MVERNKRIAKNTLLLYFRMLLTMLVTLYTSRVILQELGVVDFGIYSVVGGVVTMFSFLNISMTNGVQRFLNYELGKGNQDRLKLVFGSSLTIQTLVALLVFILAETVGLWFLNTQMTISESRIEAANWVYQFSILSFVALVYQSPYNAAVIAHQKMNIFAYASIADVLMKLLIVYLLGLFTGVDKLKLYSVLIFFISLLNFSYYYFYSRAHFRETPFRLQFDKPMILSMLGFSGWNLFGSLAHLMKSQGINILLNIFFGPVINAARGIAYQVLAALRSFTDNFMVAVRPEMIQSYARGEEQYTLRVMYTVSKFSYFLIFFLSLPVLFGLEQILTFWLGNNVPEYTALFSRLTILTGMVEVFSGPVTTVVQATGKMRKFQSICSGIIFLIVPVSYVLLKFGFPPESAMYVSLFILIIVHGVRIYLLQELIDFSPMDYIKNVLWPCIIVTAFAFIIPAFSTSLLGSTLISFLLFCLLCCLSCGLSILFLGMKQTERDLLLKWAKKLTNRLH